jgi:hypothetical protein
VYHFYIYVYYSTTTLCIEIWTQFIIFLYSQRLIHGLYVCTYKFSLRREFIGVILYDTVILRWGCYSWDTCPLLRRLRCQLDLWRSLGLQWCRCPVDLQCNGWLGPSSPGTSNAIAAGGPLSRASFPLPCGKISRARVNLWVSVYEAQYAWWRRGSRSCVAFDLHLHPCPTLIFFNSSAVDAVSDQLTDTADPH